MNRKPVSEATRRAYANAFADLRTPRTDLEDRKCIRCYRWFQPTRPTQDMHDDTSECDE